MIELFPRDPALSTLRPVRSGTARPEAEGESGPVAAPPRCVVLVEGPSDAAVLDVLARRTGLAGPGLAVVSMGGVTNFGRQLARYDDDRTVSVAGTLRRGRDPVLRRGTPPARPRRRDP